MTSDGYMCMWQISSSEHNVVGIEFNTSKAALGIGAALHFYVDLARYQNNIPVGSFSYSSPVPAMMVLTSSDEAIIVLHPSTSTQLKINYRMQTDDGWFRHGAGWLTTWFALWSFCIFCCLIAVTWIVHYRRVQARRRLRRQRGGDALGEVGRTVLLVHAELVRRREADRREQREATEALASDALNALPVKRWSSRGSSKGSATDEEAASGSAAAAATTDEELTGDDDAECCLCMEPFAPDDTCRVLPCGHFFHAECVDKWFTARAFQQRSCPLCKADPLAGTELSARLAQQGDAAAPGSRGGDAGQGEEGIELVALPQRMGGEVEEEEVLAAIEARVDALRTDRTPARSDDAAAHQSEGEAAAPAPAE